MNWINQVWQARETANSLANSSNNNNKTGNSMNWLGGAIGALQGGLGLIGQRARERRANRQNERLMGLQFENQKALNEQGQQLSMDLWNKTNAKAQMEHLKEAGLNPALMYKQGGAGGTTVGTGGGSASGGGTIAPQMMMDIGILDGMLKKAQVENVKADTEKKDAEKDSIRGVEGTEGGARIDKMVAETSNEALKGKLLELDAVLKGTDEELKRQTLKNLEVTEGQLIADKGKKEFEKDSAEFDKLMKSEDWKAVQESGIAPINRNATMLLWRAAGKNLKGMLDYFKDNGLNIPIKW